MVINQLQDDWDEQPPHVEFSYKKSVSTATALAPNEFHMVRLPPLPRTMFESTEVAGHQRLALDHLAYCDLATDRPPVARARYLSQALCPHSLSHGPPKSRPLRRIASGSQIRRWWLGAGVQCGYQHLPWRADQHERQGPQGQAFA